MFFCPKTGLLFSRFRILNHLFGKGKGAAIGAAVGAAVGTGAGVAIGHKMDKKAAAAPEPPPIMPTFVVLFIVPNYPVVWRRSAEMLSFSSFSYLLFFNWFKFY